MMRAAALLLLLVAPAALGKKPRPQPIPEPDPLVETEARADICTLMAEDSLLSVPFAVSAQTQIGSTWEISSARLVPFAGAFRDNPDELVFDNEVGGVESIALAFQEGLELPLHILPGAADCVETAEPIRARLRGQTVQREARTADLQANLVDVLRLPENRDPYGTADAKRMREVLGRLYEALLHGQRDQTPLVMLTREIALEDVTLTLPQEVSGTCPTGSDWSVSSRKLTLSGGKTLLVGVGLARIAIGTGAEPLVLDPVDVVGLGSAESVERIEGHADDYDLIFKMAEVDALLDGLSTDALDDTEQLRLDHLREEMKAKVADPEVRAVDAAADLLELAAILNHDEAEWARIYEARSRMLGLLLAGNLGDFAEASDRTCRRTLGSP